MTANEAPGRWVTWSYHGEQCCGQSAVHVYPANLTHIECGCGAWIETPQFGPEGKRIVERGMVTN